MADIATTVCPNPQKRRFNTAAFAERAAVAHSIRADTPIYSYPCACGGFHLTSKRPRRNRPSRRQRMNTNNATLPRPAIQVEDELVWSSDHVEPIEELLQRAEKGTDRARTLAATLRGLVVELYDVVEGDEKAAAWVSELEEINARKAELERLLASVTVPDVPAVDEPDADVEEEPDSEDEAGEVEDSSELTSLMDAHALVNKYAFDGRVRGWARTQGFEVARQGRIATSIVRMWIAANPDEAQA
jgi:hypothetical protein